MGCHLGDIMAESTQITNFVQVNMMMAKMRAKVIVGDLCFV